MSTMTEHEPRIIRLRTTDELAAGSGTQDENRDFRLAVTEAARGGKGTLVVDQDGEPLAVIVGATTNRARRELPRTLVADRLGRLLAQIVLADATLAKAVNEFLPEGGHGETLAERIERFLRHSQ
jgi:hypothetical protein